MKGNKKGLTSSEQLHLSISEAVSGVYQSPYNSSQEGHDDSRSNSDQNSNSINSRDGSSLSQSPNMDTHGALRTDPNSYSVSPSRYNRSRATSRAMKLLTSAVRDEELSSHDRVLVDYLLGQLDEVLGG